MSLFVKLNRWRLAMIDLLDEDIYWKEEFRRELKRRVADINRALEEEYREAK